MATALTITMHKTRSSRLAEFHRHPQCRRQSSDICLARQWATKKVPWTRTRNKILPRNMAPTMVDSGESSGTSLPRTFHLSRICGKLLILNRWFIITMSTGVISILLHQLPYNRHWLRVISVIFFVLNLVLFLLFTFLSCLRYVLYPRIFPAVLRHPHQSLFLATFPVGLATLINMTIIVCAPAWGHGLATFAWVLWWIDGLMALAACFHLTFVMWIPPFLYLYPSTELLPQPLKPLPCWYRLWNVQPEEWAGGDDGAVPHPYRRRRDRCNFWRPRGRRLAQSETPIVDARDKLHLLGYRNASVMDHPNPLLPPPDRTRATQAWSHCFTAASDWAS